MSNWYDPLVEIFQLEENLYLNPVAFDVSRENSVRVKFAFDSEAKRPKTIETIETTDYFHDGISDEDDQVVMVFEFKDEFSVKGNLERLKKHTEREMESRSQKLLEANLQNEENVVQFSYDDGELGMIEKFNALLEHRGLELEYIDIESDGHMYYRLVDIENEDE